MYFYDFTVYFYMKTKYKYFYLCVGDIETLRDIYVFVVVEMGVVNFW